VGIGLDDFGAVLTSNQPVLGYPGPRPISIATAETLVRCRAGSMQTRKKGTMTLSGEVSDWLAAMAKHSYDSDPVIRRRRQLIKFLGNNTLGKS